MPGDHAFSWNLSPAVNCGPSEILIKQLKRAQLKRAQSEFPFRCSDPEMDGSGHSVDAYQMRSICIRLVFPVAKIRRRNSSLFSLN
jgi:hypothetical protein